jgi:hypothetical protein
LEAARNASPAIQAGAFARPYRFFFPFDFLEPDGITLATVLAIELAIFATTPFLELRFFDPAVFDLVFDALLVLDFGLVVAAFFAITDTATPSPFQITLNWKFSPPPLLRIRKSQFLRMPCLSVKNIDGQTPAKKRKAAEALCAAAASRRSFNLPYPMPSELSVGSSITAVAVSPWSA